MFLLRGIDKVRGAWALLCIAHNIRKLHIPDPAGGARLGTPRVVVTEDGSDPVRRNPMALPAAGSLRQVP